MKGTRSGNQKLQHDKFQDAFEIIKNGGNWTNAETATGLNRQRIKRAYQRAVQDGHFDPSNPEEEVDPKDTEEYDEENVAERQAAPISAADRMTLDWIHRCSSADPTIHPTEEEKVEFAESLIENEGKSVTYAATVVGIGRKALAR